MKRGRICERVGCESVREVMIEIKNDRKRKIGQKYKKGERERDK